MNRVLFAGFLVIAVVLSVLSYGCTKKRTAPTISEPPIKPLTVNISRAGGTAISPFAFGNCYFDWVDWGNNGKVGLDGTVNAAKELHLNVIPAPNNQNDSNSPELFDNAQEDKYIQYCRDAGAEPIMIVPVYGNNVNGGPTSAQTAADIVTYMNGTRGYGVKYWSIGFEVDIYDQFFGTTGLPVSTAAEYAALYKSYAQAMIAANDATGSGVTLKFVGPELGWRYLPGNDWLSPMLDECKDYIDVVSIHVYGYAAQELTEDGVLYDTRSRFKWVTDYVKSLIAAHARPGTPLAVTEANVSYTWDPGQYTAATRRVGPGTFYAAVWDADRMGTALEEGLWNHSFWNLAEPAQITGNVFGFILSDPSKNPPYALTPEYYAQQMVNANFSGTTVIPSGVPDKMSVYASYAAAKSATAVLVVNKDTEARALSLAVDSLKTRTATFQPMSINIVTIPDNDALDYHMLEYTMQMADSGLAPADVH